MWEGWERIISAQTPDGLISKVKGGSFVTTITILKTNVKAFGIIVKRKKEGVEKKYIAV